MNNTIELKDTRKDNYNKINVHSLNDFYNEQGMAIECEDGEASRLVIEW